MGVRTTNNSNQPKDNLQHDGHLVNWFNSALESNSGGGGTPSLPQGIDATGGTINYYPMPGGVTWKSHVFSSTGTFVVSNISDNPSYPNAIDYLIVGGGGGAGGDLSGGGGGGGVRCTVDDTGGSSPGSVETAHTLDETGSITVTVGAGGEGATVSGAGLDGAVSSIAFGPGTLTAYGGGGGAGDSAAAPQTPGSMASGGGASSQQGDAVAGVASQGYNGGPRGASTGNSAGGGGGAGANGSSGTAPFGQSGNGGDGVATI